MSFLSYETGTGAHDDNNMIHAYLPYPTYNHKHDDYTGDEIQQLLIEKKGTCYFCFN